MNSYSFKKPNMENSILQVKRMMFNKLLKSYLYIMSPIMNG